MREISYKGAILKKERDYMEKTKEELEGVGVPTTEKTDTEDNKYVLLNPRGMLKMAITENMANPLWLHFLDCVPLYFTEIAFTRSPEYIECLLKVKDNPQFKKSQRIIKIALDKPHIILKQLSNLLDFMNLCNEFGEIYGSIQDESFSKKPFEFYVDLAHQLFTKAISKQIKKII